MVKAEGDLTSDLQSHDRRLNRGWQCYVLGGRAIPRTMLESSMDVMVTSDGV